MPDYTLNQAIITDDPPAEGLLNDGDHVFYLDGENLVELIKANGVLFEDVIGQDQDEASGITGSEIGGWTVVDDSIYSGNLALNSALDALISSDSQGDVRAKFGRITTNSFGLQVNDSTGDNEVFAVHGNTAVLAGWNISDTSISKTIGMEVPFVKTIQLTVGTNQPRFQVDYNSENRIKIGYIDSDDIGLLIKDSNEDTIMQVSSGGAGNIATIADWTIAPSKLTGGADGTTIALAPGNAIWMGANSLGDAKFSVTNAGVVKATSGTIGGWDLTATLLRSATSGNRIQLDKGKNRISIFDGSDETIVMGFLDGVVRNNASGTATTANATTLVDSVKDWEDDELNGLVVKFTDGAASGTKSEITNTASGTTITYNTMSPAPGNGDAYTVIYGDSDYGFWAQDGDYLQIDGPVHYENGDWLISHNASLRIFNGATQEVLRLGTALSGEKGLFLWDTTGTSASDVMAKFISTGFEIGDVDGSGNKISYAVGTGELSIAGTFTVQDAVLPSLAKAEINKKWNAADSTTIVSSNGDAVLYGYTGNGTTSSSVEASFMYQGSKYYIERWQGWTTNTGGTAEKTVRTIGSKAPASGTLDSYIIYETAGGTNGQPTTAAGNAPFEMTGESGDPFYRIALATRTTTVSSSGVISAVWKYDPNSTTLTTFTPTATMVVIGYCRTTNVDEIVYMQLFREAQPIMTVDDIAGWDTSNFNADGTEAALTAGVQIASGGIAATGTSSKITMNASDSTVDYGQISSVFLGLVSGVPSLSLKGDDTDADGLTWNGETLAIKGNITMDGGSIAWGSTTTSGTNPYPPASAGTYIDGSGIYTGALTAEQVTTGILKSNDEKTYFDLDNDKIIVNDGSYDRVLIGDLGSSAFGIKVSYPGYNAGTAADDQLILSTTFGIPKQNTIFADVPTIPYDDSGENVPVTFSSDSYWFKHLQSSWSSAICCPFIRVRDMKKMWLTSTGLDNGVYNLRIEAWSGSSRANSTISGTTDTSHTATATEIFSISVDVSSVAIGTECVAVVQIYNGKLLMPRLYWTGD